MIRFAFVTLATLVAMTWATSSQAATITKSQSANCLISLEGEIVEGDMARLKEAASTHLTGGDGESTAKDTICLHSPGGNLKEGTAMAEFILKNGIGTVIEDGKECYSICAVMFMMGIATGPEVNFINRKLHVTGTLGFHRPYLPINSDEMVSVRAFSIVHDLAIENVMQIMVLANTLAPWSNTSMIRADLIQAMLTHIGNDFFYIDTVEKAGRFEIELMGVPEVKGLTPEQAYYACENGFHWQVGLQKEPADYVAFQGSLTKYNGGAQVSRIVKNEGGLLIYHVESADAGYSEASCLIGVKDEAIMGCGINEAYNVQLGQGRCAVADFEERSVYLPRMIVFKPSASLASLAATPDQTAGAKTFTVTCTVTLASGDVEREPCEQRIIRGNPDEDTSDRIEFVWPTGNKTILTRGGNGVLINGKPALALEPKDGERCLVNQTNGNKFCFGE